MAATQNNNDNQITGINVTPLVDVMIVLLIIIMVTAAYIIKEAIEVELPKAAAGGETTATTLAVVITKEGKVYIDGEELTEAAIVKKIQESPEKKEDMQAIIAADRETQHGNVVRVLDLLKGLGITKFAIQVDKPE